MVDNVDQLASLQVIRETAGFNPEIFIKVDTGYGRAGLSPASEELRSLVTSVLQITGSGGPGRLCGFYSHSGHSYGVGSKTAAMKHLSDEIDGLLSAVSVATSLSTSHGGLKSGGKYVLSVGATPSATSIQNLYGTTTQSTDFNRESKRLRDSIQRAKEICKLELHAGVYPVLDMQQLATQASPSASSSLSESVTPALSVSDIALTIFTEVASVYTTRTPSEALIAAGSLALGREPCKSYSGWGVVSNWGMPWVTPVGRSGWEVGRVSQEHGILQGAVETAELPNLKVGQKVRIWPNHACVAGASFGFYLIVDSDLPKGRRNEIVDVWTRCRGW
ncbi:hypothetical protein MMC19_000270 [Ptychographa xylographoides]|nr:hypothetical protein [Ptychographa xylographoides]